MDVSLGQNTAKKRPENRWCQQYFVVIIIVQRMLFISSEIDSGGSLQ